MARGETSCEALVSSFLARIDAKNDHLNIFLSVDAEGAMARARVLDAMPDHGTALPLSGMVVAVKDVICTKDQSVTCGSRILTGFTSRFDATAVARLRAAGAILIGRTNCDEFAMGSSNENSYFGPVRNPLDPSRVPGGSSGGSAAAVAAGMCHVALGSDTGGSVRQPAAFCGVYGLKPTYGRISRHGLVAYASSFDCIGPLARCPQDLASVLAIMAGQDQWDATSAPVNPPTLPLKPITSMEGVRIGLPPEYFGEGLDSEIRTRIMREVDRFRAAGATISNISLPHTDYGIATYYVLTTAEASSNLARYDGVRYGYRADEKAIEADLLVERSSLEAALADAAPEEREQALANQDSLLTRLYAQTRTEGFGDEVKRRIMLGTYVLSAGYYDAYYEKAQRVRTLIRQDFECAFETVDVLLTPATPSPPFELGSKTADPLEMYLSDIYTVTANLAGIPGLVTPLGTLSNGLPLGIQWLGKHFDETRLLQLGALATRMSPMPE